MEPVTGVFRLCEKASEASKGPEVGKIAQFCILFRGFLTKDPMHSGLLRKHIVSKFLPYGGDPQKECRPAKEIEYYAFRHRSKPSAVLGPVDAPPCIRQRVYSPVFRLRIAGARHGCPQHPPGDSIIG